MTIQSLIDEYTPDYCKLIELAYGPNWMSDGGDAAIDAMFAGQNLKHKNILDIGSGLGGAAFRLAEKFGAKVIGLEINPWLVTEATARIPEALRSQVSFKLYNDISKLPFTDGQFDIVFSHGVLVHIDDKLTLFNEIERILNPTGSIAIYDWVTPDSGEWGPLLMQMCEAEGLTLEKTTTAQYQSALEKNNFTAIKFEAKNEEYAAYNTTIADKLNNEPLKSVFLKQFTDQQRQELLEGHLQIAESMRLDELLARNIFAKKR